MGGRQATGTATAPRTPAVQRTKAATTLCVATVGEALVLRAELPDARVVVLGPTAPADVPPAREARLELAVADERLPEGVPLHLKLDSGMGRWGLGSCPRRARRSSG